MVNLIKLSKQHEKLFPRATPESQFWKLEEEIKEFRIAPNFEEQIKELSDIIIVCGGLYRWFPETAKSVAYFYLDHPDSYLIEEEVKRKWEINLKRKWAWNGKTYHHVHD